jgi:hypothetical protein
VNDELDHRLEEYLQKNPVPTHVISLDPLQRSDPHIFQHSLPERDCAALASPQIMPVTLHQRAPGQQTRGL